MGFDIEPSRVADRQQFQFINITEEGRILDADSHRLVRAQAMRETRRLQRLRLRAKYNQDRVALKPEAIFGDANRLAIRPYREEQQTVSGMAETATAGTLLGHTSTNPEIRASESRLEAETLDIGESEDEQERCMRPSISSSGAPGPSLARRENRNTKTFKARRSFPTSCRKTRVLLVDALSGNPVVLQNGKGNRSEAALMDSVPAIGMIDPFDVIPAPSTSLVRSLIHHCKLPRLVSSTQLLPEVRYALYLGMG